MAANIKLKRSAVAGRVPTTDQLELGEVAINTADGKLYIKRNVDGAETIVLVNDAQEGVWKQFSYTASQGQTTFSGNDDNSQILSYSIGYVEVYLNGVLLDPAVDYTANTGYEIELTSPASLDDLIQIDSFASTIGPGDIVVNTFTGDNSTVSFTLTTDAGVEQNVSVFVDGVYQEKDTYSLSGTNLVFGEAPYTGASIEAVIGSRNITITEINDLTITGDFSAEGTISGSSFSGTSATLTGALASGSVTTGNIDSSGTIDADGDITTLTDVNANNVVATNDITATGDVEGASLTVTGSAGAMTWNSDEETLDIPLNSEVTLQAGQENLFRIKATEAISNGEVVMFAGAQGDHILGAKADQQSVGFSPEYVIGVATQDFSINEFGFVTTFGKVRGLNTSGYSEGDILYLNPTVAGALTTTKPTPPDHVHQIAAVLSSNPAEGTILVRPTHFSDTDEIPEGSTNLYYTDARANSAIDTRVTTAFLSNLLDAGDVDYDNTVSGISANTVQEAIDYLNTLSGGGNQGDVASYTRQTFVGTDGVSNTTFTITDGYTLGYLEVYLNGVLLNNSDYTANDESTVVLATAARDDDELITIAHDSFAIAELLRTTSISASAPDDAVTLDADGNLLVGGTSAYAENAITLRSSGQIYSSRENINAMDLSRTGTDGPILQFRKDGPIVGAISAIASYLVIGTGNTGLIFETTSNAIYPQSIAGANQNGTTDLGYPTSQFKDLYLSGNANVGGTVTAGGLTVDGSVTINQAGDTNAYLTLDGATNSYFNMDSTNGYILSGSNTIFNTNSSERMRINSAGKVGIGTTANVYGNLHLQGAQQDVILTNENADGVAGATIGRFIGQARGYSNNGAEMASIDFETNASTWYKGDIVFKTNSSDGTNPAVDAAERARIDSSGNLLVGTTDTAPGAGTSEVGVSIRGGSDNRSFFSVNSNYVASFNRNTTDGSIIELKKDGSDVGYIGTYGNTTFIQSASAADYSGLLFNNSGGQGYIEPTKSTGVSGADPRSDALVNLGSSTYRFKDIHLSGKVTNPSGELSLASSQNLVLNTNSNTRTTIRPDGVQSRHKGLRLQEMSFQTAASAFNNPTFTVASDAVYGGLHAQISAVIELHSNGLSANRAQYTKILVSCEVGSDNNLINLLTTTVSHTTIGTTPAVGTVSISGRDLHFTPNRQTNYDTYTLNTMVRSVNADFTIGA